MYLDILETAERQYKLSIALNLQAGYTCGIEKKNLFDYNINSIYGKYGLTENELFLTPEHEKIATSTLLHCSTYIICLQIDRYTEKFVPNRFSHGDMDLRNACLIARILRNAFAHDPLNPIWEIRMPEAKSKLLSVKDIITVDTTNLDGQRVKRSHYGWPHAILKMSEYIRQTV